MVRRLVYIRGGPWSCCVVLALAAASVFPFFSYGQLRVAGRGRYHAAAARARPRRSL